MGFPGGSVVNNLPAKVADTGSMPGSRKLSGEFWKKMDTHSSILPQKTPLIKEPGGLQYMDLHRIRHNLATEHSIGEFPG